LIWNWQWLSEKVMV